MCRLNTKVQNYQRPEAVYQSTRLCRPKVRGSAAFMSDTTPNVVFQQLGRMTYADAWAYQTELHEAVKARKIAQRKEARPDYVQEHHLLFVEHPPVYTLGKSGSVDHLLLSEGELAAGGFTYHKINRGGDITYHGPGQLVVYPILDLDEFFTDVHRYVRSLEEVIIRTLADYGLAAERMDGYTGVWLPQTDVLPARKICAIGVHLSRWVTLHGLAFNIDPDLSHFRNIIPCGIAEDNKAVTSLSLELGRVPDRTEVEGKVRGYFREVFEF